MRAPYQERNLGTHLFVPLTLPSKYVLTSFRFFMFFFSEPRGIVCSALYFGLTLLRWLTEQLLSNGPDSSTFSVKHELKLTILVVKEGPFCISKKINKSVHHCDKFIRIVEC
jgi:hypothetical protein